WRTDCRFEYECTGSRVRAGTPVRSRAESCDAPDRPLSFRRRSHARPDAGSHARQWPAEDPREMAARAREDLLCGAHRTGRDLSMDVSGPPKRPWEIIVASALGFFAPFFVLVALLWMAFIGGRTFRLLGWMLRE